MDDLSKMGGLGGLGFTAVGCGFEFTVVSCGFELGTVGLGLSC